MTVAMFPAIAGAADPADEEAEDNPALAARPRRLAVDVVLAFNAYDAMIRLPDAVERRKRFETEVRQRIAIVDRFCGLTDAQKEKLELAGRGDVKRHFDRIDEIGPQFRRVVGDPAIADAFVKSVNELRIDAQQLQLGAVKPGLSSDASLFIKALERILTADQAAKYASIRAACPAQGLLRIWRFDGRQEGLELVLSGMTVRDDELMHLSELADLKALALDETRVTDAGLRHLRGLSSLVVLDLKDTYVTDAGLVHLKRLGSLMTLDLNGTFISDEGVSHLEGLDGLTMLDLKNTSITDAGLVHLKGLKKLETLKLGTTRVNGAGLDHLKGLRSLKRLDLENTQVTDAGLAHMKGLTNLRELYLRGLPITDSGLEHLKGLSNLTRLSLVGTRVTGTGADDLQRVLPNLNLRP